MTTHITSTYPEFIKSITNAGEIHLCAFVNEDGSTTHTFLVTEEIADGNWDDAMARAKELNCDLPNRVEQVILYEKHKSEFKPEWYWSNTQHASISVCAWCQSFDFGGQYYYGKPYECRARFVRRLSIQ